MKKSTLTRKLQLLIICLLAFVASTSNVLAQETGHYVPGITGIKGATLPPPGSYYIMHNVFYTASSTYDGDGNEVDMDFDLNVFVNAHRFVHNWENVIFGANYAVNVIVPLQSTNISIGGFIDDKKFGLGDIIVDPMVLSWNRDRYDLSFGIGAVVPTGSYDVEEAASPGKSFWTGLFTLGGTYYFDSHKSLHASILSRYEIHSAKKDFDITPGNDFTFEWGIGKTIPMDQIWSFGASGYAHWQTTEDKGDDYMYDPTIKDKMFAAGPEVNCFIPTLKLNLELRAQFEFGVVDRSQGTKMCLSLFKSI